jgi:origin recognition complex subunit 6
MSKDSKLPKWVGPAIRVVCRELNAGKAVPHVYAGVESVLYMPCPLGEDGRLKGKMPALIAGVFFYVSIRMNGTEATQERFNEERKQVLGILRALKGNEEFAGKIGAEEADWEGWEVVSRKDVDAYIKELSDKGWLKLEWYENLVDGMGAAGEVAELVEEEDLEADEEVEREKKRKREWGQNIGRGTMKQPQFDYLSEEKRRAHAEWQAAMLAIIDKQIAKGILHGDQQMTEG